jgi:hypothetical protein
VLYGLTRMWFSLVTGNWGWMKIFAPVALAAGLWSAVVWDVRRRQRRMEGLRERHICLHCGYDIRATPDRCSECGRWASEPIDGA